MLRYFGLNVSRLLQQLDKEHLGTSGEKPVFGFRSSLVDAGLLSWSQMLFLGPKGYFLVHCNRPPPPPPGSTDPLAAMDGASDKGFRSNQEYNTLIHPPSALSASGSADRAYIQFKIPQKYVSWAGYFFTPPYGGARTGELSEK